MRTLRERIASPINILASPTAAPLPVLREIGVNRVSFGPFIFRSLIRKFLNLADNLRGDGDLTALGDMLSHAEIDEYLQDGVE